MTLPLIFALQQAGWLEKRRITYMVRNQSHKPSKVQEVIAFVKKSGGLEYATTIMERFYAEAMAILDTFPASSYQQSLRAMVQYTIERNK